MESPVRKLRKAIGLNQADFGRLIGRSHQSVREYEKPGAEIKGEVLVKLTRLAAEKGLADVALELTQEPWNVRILHPPDDFSRAQEKKTGHRRTEGPHATLANLIDSLDPNMAAAVAQVLTALARELVTKKTHSAAKES